jgi:hypothetical protein
MNRLAIGIALVAGAAYFGRRTSSGLSGPERSFVERALDDIGQFSVNQFPREELDPDADPRIENPDFKMVCPVLTPYLKASFDHLGEAFDREESGASNVRILVNQAWSAAAQPGRCPTIAAPAWLLEG